MQQVETANAQFFRVERRQVFGLPEGIRPRDGGMRQNVVGEVGFNLLERLLSLLGGDLAAKDAQADGVAEFVALERREPRGASTLP